jgi:hypothetical protein
MFFNGDGMGNTEAEATIMPIKPFFFLWVPGD